MTHRRQMGGWKNAPVVSDLQAFYDRYMLKAGDKFPKILMQSPEKATSHSLFVIDMQNDFTNPFMPPQFDTDACKNRSGAFSVADGNLMAPSLYKFIEQYNANFTKIIFSRDTHDVDHCSFADSKSGGGIFPTHCVINTEGAGLYRDKENVVNGKLNSDFRDFQSLSNTDVIFKGMHPSVETFGAMKYDGKGDYLVKRQSGKRCCTKGRAGENVAKNEEGNYKCSDGTGGFYLRNKDKANAFSDKPFSNKNANTFADIEKDFERQFEIKDLLGDNPGPVHNIYVCGLAGDFCVKDTAYNISEQLKQTNGQIGETKINVYVIHPFCRYACLPISIDLPRNLASPTFEPLTRAAAKFTEDRPEKELYYYAIKVDLVPPFNKKLMRPEEVSDELTYEGEPNGADPANQIPPPIYQHFTTDPRDILADYQTSGVKVLTNIPFTGQTSEEVGFNLMGERLRKGTNNRGINTPGINPNSSGGRRRYSKTLKRHRKNKHKKTRTNRK
jgi:nicotinamidase-related amidase